MEKHSQTIKNSSPESATINNLSEAPSQDMDSNSNFNLIRKTCIKLMCEKIVKIYDVQSKQTTYPLIQLKPLLGWIQLGCMTLVQHLHVFPRQLSGKLSLIQGLLKSI